MSQVASGMVNMNLMSQAPELRNQKSFNSKFGQASSKSGQEVKSTPQSVISSKIVATMKQGQRSDTQAMMQFS